MQKMKRLSVLLLVTIVFTACGEYQKVLNKGTVDEQYKMATDLYEQGKYNKAIQLFEKVIPKYQRKPQMERIQFMIANANYKTKNYDLASYYFNRFIGNYPNSSKIEEASFLAAHSYYLSSPKSNRDQADTEKALNAFQGFIDKYPNSDKLAEANKYYDELSKRLEKKAFDNAKLYYKTEHYKAAIVALDTFLEDNFGTIYKEDAMAYKFLASYELAMKSVDYKKEKRINDAILTHQRFEKSFPTSTRIKEFAGLVENLQKELKLLKKQQEKFKTNGL
ncbi:MAG TPA: outer membrane protein assembly factor BamD [Flavobacteriia bacterium]|jgi:outer membrane protein assembly factor BamD|nr:outer membrane protein assembly factor BamD [Flavobacteriia bacterium]